MKINIEYPAFVVARHKGGRVQKAAVIAAEGEFDLTVTTADQAPLAFRIHRRKRDGIQTRDVRAFGGRLYRPIPQRSRNDWSSPRSLDEIVERMAGGYLNSGGIYENALDLLERAVSSADIPVLPSGIKSALDNFDPRSGFSSYNAERFDADALMAASSAMATQIEMDEEVATQIKHWHGLVQADLSDYLVIDRAVYTLCGEPVYRISNTVTAAFLEAPDLSLLTFTFAADAGDQAEAEALRQRVARAGDPHGDVSIMDDLIEVIDPDYVTWRAEERDFERYARSIQSSISRAIAELSDKYGHIRIPRSVYNAWLDLRDFLDSFEKDDALPEPLEDLLTEALDEWTAFRGSLEDTRGLAHLYRVDEDIRGRLFSRYAERPISLTTGIAFSFIP